MARKPSLLLTFLKIFLIMLTAVFVLFGLFRIFALLIAIVTGIGAYFATMNADIEYEYLYLEKEISVDKVMAKRRRLFRRTRWKFSRRSDLTIWIPTRI